MSASVQKWFFRGFGATHGGWETGVKSKGAYGRTRARNSGKPARPNIWRLRVFRRLICPSTWPLLQGVSTAARTAEKSFSRPTAKRATGSIPECLAFFIQTNKDWPSPHRRTSREVSYEFSQAEQVRALG